MNQKFATLISGDFATSIDRFLLGTMYRSRSAIAFTNNGPLAIVRNHMLPPLSCHNHPQRRLFIDAYSGCTYPLLGHGRSLGSKGI
jgi:hypothetical protein